MYTKRVQIINYGPIDQLVIEFPFDGEAPKPVVIVGRNGSGKSILLSHIVNGLISAQGCAYPETPEVETGKVFKLRDSSYIRSGREASFARVDYEDGLFMGEVRAKLLKEDSGEAPSDLITEDSQAAWNQMPTAANDRQVSNIDRNNETKIKQVFSRNCVLYFPPNRFEEPAWLNQKNLLSQAEYMDLEHLQGHTNRKVINHSPLHDNQDWLFEVVYDRAVFETQTINVQLPVQGGGPPDKGMYLVFPASGR